VPAMQYVRTTGLCRVLVIPRSVYNTLAADYPMSARAVLDNLQTRAEQVRPNRRAAVGTLQCEATGMFQDMYHCFLGGGLGCSNVLCCPPL
jgi:CRP-like cAMP-binding protein